MYVYNKTTVHWPRTVQNWTELCFQVKYNKQHNTSRQWLTCGSLYTQQQARLVQTDYTVSLPGFPTLLSAEGDFLIKAGSIYKAQYI